MEPCQTIKFSGAGSSMFWGVAGSLVAGWLALGAGCQLVGGMMSSYEETGTHTVAAKYDGITGKSFAVVVAAHPVIQSDFPDLVPYVTERVSTHIVNSSGPSGWVPPQFVGEFQASRPAWSVMSPAELAAELGVQRLVYIDLTEFRLNDTGNQYIWNGLAAATVNVVEADGTAPDQFAFQDTVSVGFPDSDINAGPMQIPAQTVYAALAKRFVDRASWLFFTHEEANNLEY